MNVSRKRSSACCGFGRGVRNHLIVFSRMATPMGLETWAAMPAAILFYMSSEKALAVIAMMGMVLPRGFLPPRMAFVAS